MTLKKLSNGYRGIPISLRKEKYIYDCVEFLIDVAEEIGFDTNRFIYIKEEDVLSIMDEITPDRTTFSIAPTGALGYFSSI